MMAPALAAATLGISLLALPATASGHRSPSATGTYNAFGAPQAVSIQGYSGTAMEPFITPDGGSLVFNTSNASPNIPALQYATIVDGQTFSYQGEIEGANQAGALSGTPSLDDDGNLYFISTRSYSQTLSTVYTGSFASGAVTDVHLVSGISGATPGTVDFDAAVSPDGDTLYVSVGTFSGGAAPTNASLALYEKSGDGFVPDPHSAHVLHAVDKKRMLAYAAAISADGLELFFTRDNPKGGEPTIYRAVRTRFGKPFGHVQRVGAITGFAEAPSLSADGRTLYYHLLVGNQFDIETVTRP